jgi:hypothetical protein
MKTKLTLYISEAIIRTPVVVCRSSIYECCNLIRYVAAVLHRQSTMLEYSSVRERVRLCRTLLEFASVSPCLTDHRCCSFFSTHLLLLFKHRGPFVASWLAIMIRKPRTLLIKRKKLHDFARTRIKYERGHAGLELWTYNMLSSSDWSKSLRSMDEPREWHKKDHILEF